MRPKSQQKKGKGSPQNAGPKSRLKPLLAVLLLVVVGAGAFLLLSGGDDDSPVEVADVNAKRTTTTAAGGDTTSGSATPTTPSTEAPAETTPTTVVATPPPPSGPALTPTQQRELCHVAFVGLAEGKPDTGDPLETCTPQDWMSVGLEVSIYLHGDPNQDRAAMLKAECEARRAVGASPKACQGI